MVSPWISLNMLLFFTVKVSNQMLTAVLDCSIKMHVPTYDSHGLRHPGAPLMKVVVNRVLVERLLNLPLLPPHADERPPIDRREAVVP